MMTWRTTSQDFIVKSREENKTVLSWTIRSPIVEELRERRMCLVLLVKRRLTAMEREGKLDIISHFALECICVT